MSDSIEIKVDNAELQRYLNKLTERTSDLRPLMRNIAGIMADSVESNFEPEGRPKWQDFLNGTIKQRKKKGYYPGKILQMRGELAASITSSYDEDSAMVGTNKVYAAIHQFGGDAGRGKKVKIPARPYLKVGDEELKQINDSVSDYLAKY